MGSEPAVAPMLTSGTKQERKEVLGQFGAPAAGHPSWKPHPIQGWAPNFIPKVLEEGLEHLGDGARHRGTLPHHAALRIHRRRDERGGAGIVSEHSHGQGVSELHRFPRCLCRTILFEVLYSLAEVVQRSIFFPYYRHFLVKCDYPPTGTTVS